MRDPVEVVPGVSAYQAAAAALERELTVPGVVRAVVLSRAGGRTGVPEREQLERLASGRVFVCISVLGMWKRSSRRFCITIRMTRRSPSGTGEPA